MAARFPSFLRKKAKLSFCVFFLIIFGLVLPFSVAEAIWGIPGPGSIADAIGKAIGHIIASFILAIPTILLMVSATILSWAIDPWFIRLPYTSGGVVDIGWPIVRDLANMGIVMALVVIGLATALRLEEYQARKTLPRLILVALLINFTPVILGVIVDATNIIMNFFLAERTNAEGIWRQYLTISESIGSSLGGINFFEPFQNLAFFAKLMIIVIFDLVASIIFLLYAFLFVARRVVIWMLVIFSPIAFVAWILPATRGLWSTWWNQFIQWSIIGIFAAFFLYLGGAMIIVAAQGGFISEVPAGGGVGGLAQKYIGNTLNDVLPYLVALIFLLFGFFVALTTSAMGAKGIISTAQKGARKAGAVAGAFGVGAVRGIPAVSRTEENVRRRLEAIPVVGRAVGGVGAYEKERKDKMSQLGKPFESLPPAEIRRALQQPPITRNDRLKQARLFEVLREKGELSNAEIAYLPMAQRMNLDMNAILRRRPDWAPQIGQTIDQAVARADPEEFRKDVQADALANPEVALRIALDERIFIEMERKARSAKKRQFRNTMLTGILPPAIIATLTPRDINTLTQRATRIINDPAWQ